MRIKIKGRGRLWLALLVFLETVSVQTPVGSWRLFNIWLFYEMPRQLRDFAYRRDVLILGPIDTPNLFNSPTDVVRPFYFPQGWIAIWVGSVFVQILGAAASLWLAGRIRAWPGWFWIAFAWWCLSQRSYFMVGGDIAGWVGSTVLMWSTMILSGKVKPWR